MTISNQPALFGIQNSNKDFTKPDTWGKNQFNNCFPIALTSYMGANHIEPVYLRVDENLTIIKETISVASLFGYPALDQRLYFEFEGSYTPFTDLVLDKLPRADVVTHDLSTTGRECLRWLEIKLTALPDQTTFRLPEAQYGCELVIRPGTIIYLVLSLATIFRAQRSQLVTILDKVNLAVTDWHDIAQIRASRGLLKAALLELIQLQIAAQCPVMLQPIFKTVGKRGILAHQCFDVFVWSNYALVKLFADAAERLVEQRFSRQERSLVWLFKMLYHFAQTGKIDASIVNTYSYGTKNDKALALPGRFTNRYMASNELLTPRIPQTAVRDIILNGGQNYLSPERRLDAILVNSPTLFQ